MCWAVLCQDLTSTSSDAGPAIDSGIPMVGFGAGPVLDRGIGDRGVADRPRRRLCPQGPQATAVLMGKEVPYHGRTKIR